MGFYVTGLSNYNYPTELAYHLYQKIPTFLCSFAIFEKFSANDIGDLKSTAIHII